MTVLTKTTLQTLDLAYGGTAFADILASNSADTAGSLNLAYAGAPFTGFGAGGTSVDLAVGSIVFTGHAPTVTIALAPRIPSAAGALTFTGHAPTVHQTQYKQGDGVWICVLEITIPVTTGSPTTETFYFSERAMITTVDDTPPNYLFRELLLDAGSVKRDIPLANRVSGLVTGLFGTAKLDNTEGVFDSWIDYGTHGGVVVCRWGPWRGSYPDDFFHVYTAYIEGNPIIGFSEMELPLRGADFYFEKSVVTEGFDGSGDLEGTGAAGTNVKQRVLGAAYITPILVDEINNVFFLTAGTSIPTPVDLTTQLLFNGGNPLTLAGSYTGPGAPEPGSFLERRTAKGLYAYLGAAPDVELRGYVEGETWDILDLADAAGIDLTETNTSTGTLTAVFSAGNRVITNQTYAQVFTDIAKYEVAIIGFDRLSRFFSRSIRPSTYSDGGASWFTFSESNSRNWKVVPGAGNGRRVWRVNVKAFPHKKSRLVGTIADNSYLEDPNFSTAQQAVITEHRPNLIRDPYMSQFTASSFQTQGWANLIFSATSVIKTDPGAEEVTITLDADNFDTEADMLAFGERYLEVFGARQFAMTLETDLTPSIASLELLDKVDVNHTRFNSSNRTLRIAGITLNLRKRTVEFLLWGQADIPGDVEITFNDALAAAAANGGGVGINSETGVSDGRDFSIPLGDEVSTVTTGTAKRTWYCPFDFRIEEVIAFLKTPQTGGSTYTVDILADGVSIFSGSGSPQESPSGQKLTIDNNEASSLTAAVPCTLITTFFPKGTKVVFNIDQVGNGTAVGPSVSITGYRTA